MSSGRRWFAGVRGRLAAGFLLVILVSVGGVTLAAQAIGVARLDEIGQLVARRRAFRVAPLFAAEYRQAGNWNGAAALAQSLAEPLPPELTEGVLSFYPGRMQFLAAVRQDRLVLAGPDGRVVVDTGAALAPGDSLPAELQPLAVPLVVDGQAAGQLILTSALEAAMAETVLGGLRRSLAAAGALAALLAVVAALLLTGWLITPIQRLNRAARRLAAGESSAPLPVESQDELGELTASFNQMAGSLERQKQLRRQMVADIAHELRTPLSVMRLDVEALADGLQPPADAAQSLGDEIGKLNRLIEDLRQLSLADAGAIQFEMDSLDVGPFLAQMAEAWHNAAQARQVELRTDIAAGLPPVLADAGRLAQVFDNLLGNALRHTPAGQPVTLGAAAGAGEVRMWVADSGPGIPPADLPHIFERFYRADPARSRSNGGTGLGLAIARQWIRLHGGRIWAENQPGAGACFTIALPEVSRQ